jgi:hypothetical protein
MACSIRNVEAAARLRLPRSLDDGDMMVGRYRLSATHLVRLLLALVTAFLPHHGGRLKGGEVGAEAPAFGDGEGLWCGRLAVTLIEEQEYVSPFDRPHLRSV